MPLPRVPQLQNFYSVRDYESAWRSFMTRMEPLRPTATEYDLDRELIGALCEYRKVKERVEQQAC